MIAWDEAARSAGEGAPEKQRERAREAGPPRREKCYREVLERLQRGIREAAERHQRSWREASEELERGIKGAGERH